MFHPWVEKIPWRGHGNPLQYSCMENPMDRVVWRAAVHGIEKSRTQLKQFRPPHTIEQERHNSRHFSKTKARFEPAPENMCHIP